eukprot:2966094-Rhodomonas_salina.3
MIRRNTAFARRRRRRRRRRITGGGGASGVASCEQREGRREKGEARSTEGRPGAGTACTRGSAPASAPPPARRSCGCAVHPAPHTHTHVSSAHPARRHVEWHRTRAFGESEG